MSAEASVAVFENAKGSDAEWRMLMTLANAANPRGVVFGLSMAELAERTGKSERGAAQIKRRLIDSGQLVALDEGGGRGKVATYWLRLPGLAGPETPQEEVEAASENGEAAPADSERSRTRTTKRSSSSASAPASLREELRDADVPAEMVADAESLLRDGRKVGSKLVTPAEMSIAAAGLAAFNREFEWNDRKGSDFGLGASLTSIVMRVRERPTWDGAKHVRLVESAWRFRWWEQTGRRRRPNPNVVWGDKAFAEVIQDAAEEAAGKKKSERHYTRRDRG